MLINRKIHGHNGTEPKGVMEGKVKTEFADRAQFQAGSKEDPLWDGSSSVAAFLCAGESGIIEVGVTLNLMANSY